MIKLLLCVFRYSLFILCILTLCINSDAYCFFGFSSAEKEAVQEEDDVETSESLNTRDSLPAVTESSLEAQRQILDREEKKIEELQEIQSSFLDKVSTDSEIPQADEEIDDVPTSVPTTPDPYRSDWTRPSYSSSYQFENKETIKEEAVTEAPLSEITEKNTPIQIPVADDVRKNTASDLIEKRTSEPARSFFGGRQKEPIKPAPQESRYSSGARPQNENVKKAKTQFGSQKNEKVKFCKNCGREYKVDDPRIFCPRDGTPLQIKDK